MTTYTVFVGAWDDGDPDWITEKITGLSWDEARTYMLESLQGYEHDECTSCRDSALEGIRQLTDSIPGKFQTEVDGNDYLIIPEG